MTECNWSFIAEMKKKVLPDEDMLKIVLRIANFDF
jgi:hypothetical protein